MPNVNRRNFMKFTGAAGVLGFSGCIGFPAITAVRSPNGLLRHASVGTANMAGGDIGSLKTHPKIEMAAFCDVDSAYLDKRRKEFPNARFYRDWREMLEAEGDRIDSLNVSIPDHNHTVVAAAAMRRGKHVYLQKPLCKTHAQAALLRRLAVENGVVTQMGAQFNASLSDRQTVAILKSGVLGPVQDVYFFSTRKGLSRRKRHLPAAVPPPKTLDWNLWLGTAKERPFAPEVYHPLIWRVWHDFGSGWIGDIGCHLMSAVWRGMELGDAAPYSVFAETKNDAATPEIEKITWPLGSHLTFKFKGVAASGGEEFHFHWYDGCSAPDSLAPANLRPPAEIDALFEKTPIRKRPFEGKAVKCCEGWILQPHGGGEAFVLRNSGKVEEAPVLGTTVTHYHEFVNACLEGRKATADFDWSTWMMETVLQGETAERFPMRTLGWNAGTRSFGDAAVDHALDTHCRKGWEI